jgi:hypothetical protein
MRKFFTNLLSKLAKSVLVDFILGNFGEKNAKQPQANDLENLKNFSQTLPNKVNLFLQDLAKKIQASQKTLNFRF